MKEKNLINNINNDDISIKETNKNISKIAISVIQIVTVIMMNLEWNSYLLMIDSSNQDQGFAIGALIMTPVVFCIFPSLILLLTIVIFFQYKNFEYKSKRKWLIFILNIFLLIFLSNILDQFLKLTVYKLLYWLLLGIIFILDFLLNVFGII